ncbi:alpha/beta fold hydrolase [Sulfurospirillum oryzae]|uniref:alpha/beta fold hydrolase n=1 Tax=Sulfurospirillum oryzae TaxID=2976535 RepID=UPI0021E6E95B|nr:alpha/beta hydrolase [Sulfurospirillum oryzae]
MKKTVGGLSVLLEGNQKNRAIIFLHGFPYDHTMWSEQIAALRDTYYCVAYDIRGLGDSSVGDGQFTMESFVDDLEMLIRELRIEKPPILCGFSMGGYIVLRAVERMESNFSAVILCDTTSNADDNEAKLKRSDVIRRINAQGLSSFSKNFIGRCYSDVYKKEHKEAVDKRIAKSIKFNSIGVKGCLFAMLTRNDTSAYLPSIELPTLLLCGELDALTPPLRMKAMADQIKDAQFVLIKHAAHMSVVENPTDCNEAMKAFLAKL